ncbi:hypothetical protein BDZ91DRAFT_734541 [Kalaharituber pfeilii]|nr:hypothetical protein BDZ91DRAFT_734541 [Kalaharituber pfeilii]
MHYDRMTGLRKCPFLWDWLQRWCWRWFLGHFLLGGTGTLSPFHFLRLGSSGLCSAFGWSQRRSVRIVPFQGCAWWDQESKASRKEKEVLTTIVPPFKRDPSPCLIPIGLFLFFQPSFLPKSNDIQEADAPTSIIALTLRLRSLNSMSVARRG